MPNMTTFDSDQRYILLPVYIVESAEKRHEFDALLDTGAPSTEFSGQALQYAGLLKEPMNDVQLKPGLQTQKYGKITIHEMEICSHTLRDLNVYISHFDESWGIDALIGLDFFRRFRTTIDYHDGVLITEPY